MTPILWYVWRHKCIGYESCLDVAFLEPYCLPTENAFKMNLEAIGEGIILYVIRRRVSKSQIKAHIFKYIFLKIYSYIISNKIDNLIENTPN